MKSNKNEEKESSQASENWKKYEGSDTYKLMFKLYGKPNKPKINYPPVF